MSLKSWQRSGAATPPAWVAVCQSLVALVAWMPYRRCHRRSIGGWGYTGTGGPTKKEDPRPSNTAHPYRHSCQRAGPDRP
eukprot:365151-Chlamydomonas_euryale.AAC.11